jgi:dienelactone hydrolase
MAAFLLCAGLCASAQAPDPATNAAASAARRDLWLGDEGRYVRRWLLSGPLSVAQADEVAKIGAGSTLGPAQTATWRAQGTYGDILDGFGGLKDGEAGFALASVEREDAADATLLLGGNVRGVWVNGAWMGGGANTPAFVIDGTALRVRLDAGTNRILLRVERVDRPVLLTMRVVRPGYRDDYSGNVAPFIPLSADGGLRIVPGRRDPGDDVSYAVLGPGGITVARANLPRREDARFDSAKWKDGPYEVRVSTRSNAGNPVTTWLPWYKGDAAAAALRLLEAAARPGSPAQLQMLADMVRDRGGQDWRALHSPLMEYEELQLEARGRAGGARASGFVRLGWTDDVDGSTQFCRAYLPAVWPPKQPAPTLIFLHGYNPPNPPYVRWWSVGERHNGVAERHGLIVLEPMGRGNVDYRWMGERDVLRCLDEARRRLKVDDERVYISGESMGGNGTWLIASRNPQRFAAAAPVYGGWDYRTIISGYNYTNPSASRPMERFIQEAHASFAGAEGLRNVPLYVLHGDADAAVPVEQSRHGVRLLQRWGYDVRYREIPGLGHEDLEARDEIADWLLGHRRDGAPREVRLRSYDLAGARAHWLKVTGFANPFEMIEASATVLDPQTIRLDTRNVVSLELAPPPGLFLQDAAVSTRTIMGIAGATIVWNGKPVAVFPRRGQPIALRAEGFEPGERDKNPAREGRLTYFFDTPFAIVVGTTSKDPVLAGGLAAKADALADLWERWQHVRPRLLRDTDISAAEQQAYSLLLLGGPADNAVAAKLAAQLPLEVTRDTVTVDGRRFTTTDAVAQMIYPHPLNDRRYLLLVQPTSAAGLRFWNPQQYWHALNGFPMNFWDWTIVDGRHVMQESGLFPDRGWVAAGVFDIHWKRNDAFTVPGDPELRARATLRHPPPAGFKLPAAALDALTGRYRVNPGQIGAGGLINVARDGETLTASAPEGGRAWPIEPETDSDFAIVGLGTPVSFLRDGGGTPTGLVYHYNGQEIVATRLPSDR